MEKKSRVSDPQTADNCWVKQFLGLVLIGVLAGCQTAADVTHTPIPTSTPVPAEATATPLPPTETPPPTNTPEPTATPTPAMEEATVLRIIDGDTIEVEMNGEKHTVRYIGLDLPLPEALGTLGYMSVECTEANRELVEGQVVYFEKDVLEEDDFGRLLRYVYLADGTFVNAELLTLGFAQAKADPPNIKYQDLFAEEESKAVNLGIGLWAPKPVRTDCWLADIQEDGSIPEGTWIEFGKSFTKTWNVRNAGTCIWKDVVMFSASGTSMRSGRSSVVSVGLSGPGHETNIGITLTAPNVAGLYTNEWRFRSPDGTEFGSLTVTINAGIEP